MTSATSSSPLGAFSILPLELRNRIYQTCLTLGSPRRNHHSPNRPPKCLNLLSTSHQIHSEALPYLYINTPFTLLVKPDWGMRPRQGIATRAWRIEVEWGSRLGRRVIIPEEKLRWDMLTLARRIYVSIPVNDSKYNNDPCDVRYVPYEGPRTKDGGKSVRMCRTLGAVTMEIVEFLMGFSVIWELEIRISAYQTGVVERLLSMFLKVRECRDVRVWASKDNLRLSEEYVRFLERTLRLPAGSETPNYEGIPVWDSLGSGGEDSDEDENGEDNESHHDDEESEEEESESGGEDPNIDVDSDVST